MREAIAQYHLRYLDPQRYRQRHVDDAQVAALSAILQSSSVPFTAWEAYVAATETVAKEAGAPLQQPQGQGMAAAKALVPTLSSKQQQRDVKAAKEAADPAAALAAALRQAGMLPLPPGTDATPLADGSCPDLQGQAQAAGWRCQAPLFLSQEFEARLEAAAGTSGTWLASIRNHTVAATKESLVEAVRGAEGRLPGVQVQRAEQAAGAGLVVHRRGGETGAEAGSSTSMAAEPGQGGVALDLPPVKLSGGAAVFLEELQRQWTI